MNGVIRGLIYSKKMNARTIERMCLIKDELIGMYTIY